MSAIFMFVLAVGMLALAKNILNIAIILIGIGFLIFIHELGHFLAAKFEKVRVEAFALGFGPCLFSKKYGDTEYKLNLIPLGGYVKMAGEVPGEDEIFGKPDELLSKRPAQRARIFVAGVFMNALFAVVGTILAFQIGVRFICPQVGQVMTGEPAWEAGLRTGDTILAIDGQKVNSFSDISIKVAFCDIKKGVVLEYQRAGQKYQVQVQPRYNPALGLAYIGIMPEASCTIRVRSDSAAQRAGLRNGDVILALDGKTVTNGSMIQQVLKANRGQPVVFTIKRGQQKHQIKVTPTAAKVYRLGVGPRYVLGKLTPDGLAYQIGLRPGDQVLQLAGSSFGGFDDLSQPFTLKVQTDKAQAVRIPLSEFLVQRLQQFAQAGAASSISCPLGPWGLGPDDLPLKIQDQTAHSWSQVAQIFTQQAQSKVPLEILRSHGKRQERLQLGIPRLKRYEFLSSLQLVPTTIIDYLTPNYPAQQQGLQVGDRIVQIADTKVRQWEDLSQFMNQVQKAKPLRLTYVRQGQSHTIMITPRQHACQGIFGIGLTHKLTAPIRLGILESCHQGLRHSQKMVIQILLFLKSLFTRKVAAKTIGGPITIFMVSQTYLEYGFGSFIYFMAIISINLAVINLLPIPILDGFHLLLLGVEKIKGSRVSDNIQMPLNYIGFILLMLLMIFVIANELLRLIG